MTTLTPDSKTWYIAHNARNVFHYGEIEAGQSVTTGQPNFETFPTENEWNLRKIELGIITEDN